MKSAPTPPPPTSFSPPAFPPQKKEQFEWQSFEKFNIETVNSIQHCAPMPKYSQFPNAGGSPTERSLLSVAQVGV